MLLVIDALNRPLFRDMLDDMYRLRGRIFGPPAATGPAPLTDEHDLLHPAYIVHLDPRGRLNGALRLLQTTGPHLLADSLSDLLAGEAPLRSARLWEASQVCVDPATPGADRVAATLMAGALDYARHAGVLDMVVLMDAPLDRMLSRQGPAYDYLGLSGAGTVAALMDCAPQRIQAFSQRAGLMQPPGFASSEQALQAYGRHRRPSAQRNTQPDSRAALIHWCEEQIRAADTPEERAAAEALRLELSPFIDDTPVRRCKA